MCNCRYQDYIDVQRFYLNKESDHQANFFERELVSRASSLCYGLSNTLEIFVGEIFGSIDNCIAGVITLDKNRISMVKYNLLNALGQPILLIGISVLGIAAPGTALEKAEAVNKWGWVNPERIKDVTKGQCILFAPIRGVFLGVEFGLHIPGFFIKAVFVSDHHKGISAAIAAVAACVICPVAGFFAPINGFAGELVNLRIRQPQEA